MFPIKTGAEIYYNILDLCKKWDNKDGLARQRITTIGIRAEQERFWPCSDLKQRLLERAGVIDCLIKMAIDASVPNDKLFISILQQEKEALLLMAKACDSEEKKQ